jgi:hypothetical protein
MKFMNIMILIYTDHFNDSDTVIAAFKAYISTQRHYENTRRKMLVCQLLLVQQKVAG